MCWPYFRITLPCKRRLSLCNQLPLKVPWTLSWTRHANWRVVQVLWWFRMRSFLPARQIIRNVEDSKSFSKSAYPFSESLGFLPWSFSWFGTKRRNKWPNKSTSSWNLAPLIHQFRVLTLYQGGSGLLEGDKCPNAQMRGKYFQYRKTGHFVRNCPDLNGRQHLPCCCSRLWNKDYLLLICIYFYELSIVCAHFIPSRLASSLSGLLGEASSKGFSKVFDYSVPGRGISELLRFGVFPLAFCSFLF